MTQKKYFHHLLTLDEMKNRCLDKIARISLVHGTGHITGYTKNGKEFTSRRDDLISELITDQQDHVIKNDYCLFEDFIKIQYVDKRSFEFQQIVTKARLNIINIKKLKIIKTFSGVYEVIVHLHNTVPTIDQNTINIPLVNK